jgi:hypothetical protein
MSDPNAKRKHEALERAKKIGNRKVLKYLEDGLFEKLDQLGPHGGVFLEGLEHDWAKFAKPEGLLHGFTDKDFEALHKALFGLGLE